jgi:hypothetical protein
MLRDYVKIHVRNLTGCCPNHFSLALKHFLINLRLVPGDPKTRPSVSNSWNRLSFTSPRFMNKKRFNERSKRFSFGQQPVKFRIRTRNTAVREYPAFSTRKASHPDIALHILSAFSLCPDGSKYNGLPIWTSLVLCVL